MQHLKPSLSRRDLLRSGAATLLGAAGAVALAQRTNQATASPPADAEDPDHPVPSVVGEVDHERNGFNPTDILTDFDYGEVSTLENGQTLRKFRIAAVDKTIEIVPGIEYPAWTYNGRVPGPTLRAREGDRVRVHFGNASSHAHTIHFHGIHPFEMDGVPGAGPGLIETGQNFTYEFDAEPFGVHLHHCHAFPLARQIAKGLYGAFIIDPKEGWPPVDHEFVMVM